MRQPLASDLLARLASEFLVVLAELPTRIGIEQRPTVGDQFDFAHGGSGNPRIRKETRP